MTVELKGSNLLYVPEANAGVPARTWDDFAGWLADSSGRFVTLDTSQTITGLKTFAVDVNLALSKRLMGVKSTGERFNLVNLRIDSRIEAGAAGLIYRINAGPAGVEINTSKMKFFGTGPVAQPVANGVTAGFTAGTGTSVNDDSTFTGNVGTAAYTIGDIVAAMKTLGLIASS